MLSSTSLLHSNCIFNRNNTVATQQGLKTYWLCKSYRVSMCRARCITHQGQVISSTGVHNHPPHMKGPHEYSHQQPQLPPPPPPPSLGPPHDHSNNPPSMNNGTYHEYHSNAHFQSVPNHAIMGPPPYHETNQYQSHHQPHSYPENPGLHHQYHSPHPYQHPPHQQPFTSPSTSSIPPQQTAIGNSAPGDPQPLQVQSELPPNGGPPVIVRSNIAEPDVPPDIKLIQLQPVVTSDTDSQHVDTTTSGSTADEQQLQLKTEQLS